MLSSECGCDPDYSFTSAMCVMILNYLDKKSIYIGLYKTPNKAVSCPVLS